MIRPKEGSISEQLRSGHHLGKALRHPSQIVPGYPPDAVDYYCRGYPPRRLRWLPLVTFSGDCTHISFITRVEWRKSWHGTLFSCCLWRKPHGLAVTVRQCPHDFRCRNSSTAGRESTLRSFPGPNEDTVHEKALPTRTYRCTGRMMRANLFLPHGKQVARSITVKKDKI